MDNKALIDKTDGVLKMLTNSGAADMLYNHAKHMMWSVVEYKELQMLYTCAMKEITTKLEILDTEFKIRYKRNPISSVTSRLKRTESIMKKLANRGHPFNIESIEKNLNDIAGVRVICTYVDDIYAIADSLLSQDDVNLISKKDYIKNPKPNGYRSLHLIVSIPVFLSEGKKNVKVEVQIRTIAMDYWASLEHQMKYKKDIPDAEAVGSELCLVAELMADTDKRMLELRRRIELAEDISTTEEDELLERLSRLGMPI